jgi:preprotein translocase subunit SecE
MNRESKRRAARAQARAEGRPTVASEPAKAPAPGKSKTSPVEFLGEVRSELRKVAWPNRKEVVSYTIVVLVTTLVLTLIVYGMDYIIREAVVNTLG